MKVQYYNNIHSLSSSGRRSGELLSKLYVFYGLLELFHISVFRISILQRMKFLVTLVALLTFANLTQAQTATSLATGNWTAPATWTQSAKTGTITAATNSTTVTGVGTKFLSEIQVGATIIRNPNKTVGVVQSVTNDLTLVLTANASNSAGADSYTANGVMSGDDVHIANGTTVTVNATSTCKSLTFDLGTNGTLTVNNPLTVTNDINAVSGSSNGTYTLNGSSSISCTNLNVCDATAPNGSPTNTFTLNSAVTTLNVSGNVVMTAALSGGKRNNPVFNLQGGTLTVGGTIRTTGGDATNTYTLTTSTTAGTPSIINLTGATPWDITGTGAATITLNGAYSTVNYNSSSAQTVRGTTYTTLKINNSNSSGATLGAATTVTTLTIGDVTSSILNDGGYQLTSTGTLNLTSGTFKLGSATAATTWPAFATNTISLGTTVEYASGQAQTVSTAPSYQHLTFSGAGTKTIAASSTVTVGGNWSVTGGAATLNSLSNVIVTGNITGNGPITSGSGTITLDGAWSNTGTFTPGTGTVNYHSSSAQSVASLNYYNLTSSGGGAKTLAGAVNVSNVLTLTSGVITSMASNLLAVTNTASASVTGTFSSTNYINGPLQWSLATGNSYLFPVGDASNYRPFEMNSISCSTPVVRVTMASTGASGVNSPLTSVAARNWHAELISGSFTSATIRITEGSLVSTNVVASSSSQAGNYSTQGGNSIGATITSNAAIAYTASTYFAIGTILVPSIALSDNGTQIAAANVSVGTTNVVLHHSALAVTVTGATLTGIACTTAGTYVSADITNLKVWYQTGSIFDSGTATLLSTYTTPGAAGAKTFPSFTSQAIGSGSTGYIFITADVATGAVVNHTINLSALTTGDFTFSSGTKSGSTTAGGAQTIVAGALDHFAISSFSSPQTAGTAITGITLTARDAYNNTVTGFTGTVVYSGTAGITGTSAAFNAGELTNVSVTPTAAGTGKTFIVTGSTKTGTSTFDVIPGALDHFAISAISAQTALTAITGITLTAQDANNNTVTSFASTVAYSGTAGITGTSAAFTAGELTNVSVTPTLAGNGRTFIVTGTSKTGTSTFDVSNPIPTITNISPLTKCAGSAGFTLTVYGTKFVALSVVNIAGNPKATTFVNSGQLTATILDTDIASLGTPSITVTNPTPGGGTSSGYSFIVSEVSIGTSIAPITCYSDGSITITPSGGISPYTYLWNDGNTTGTRTGLLPGNYSLTVTDANGCSATSGTLTLSAVVGGCPGITVCKTETASVLSVPPDPANTTYTWTIESVASRGTYYTNKISAGQSTPSITVNWTTVPIGEYEVKVIASNASCGSSAPSYQSVYVKQVTATASADAVCSGGNLKLYASGGISYSWTGPNSFTSSSANPIIYNVNNATHGGTYTVTVTDDDGCSATANVVVSVGAGPTLSLAASNPVATSVCGGTDGSISIVTDGTLFSWSNGAVTQNISGLSAGNYTVTVTNTGGCSTQATYAVLDGSAPTLSTAQGNVTCYGGSDGYINLTVSGGTAGCTFSWTASNGGVVPSGQSTTQNPTGLVAGTYNVTVTKGACISSTSATITQYNPLQATINFTNVTCNGSNNGTITLSNPYGGAGTYEYRLGSGTWQSSGNFTGLSPANYSVQIRDAVNTSCVVVLNSSLAISQPAAALAASPVPAVTDVSCNGGSDGQIILSVTGGTSPYTYAWTGPSGYTATTKDISGRIAGTYNVTITDSKGCQLVLSGGTAITISEPNVLNATVNNTSISCFGANDGTITVSSPSGGSGTWEYRLDAGSWQSGGSFTGLAQATYSVKIRDAAHPTCFVTLGNQIITEPSVLNASVAKTNITCNGLNDGTITVSSPSGGYGTWQYRLNSGTWQDGGNFTGLSAGTYNVQIRDKAHTTCFIALGDQTISNPPVISTSASVTNVLCYGASTGVINITPSGGTPNGSAPYYSFLWSASNGGVVPGGHANDEDLTLLHAGDYSVIVTDANGCNNTFDFTITQIAALSLLTSKTDITCFADNDGSINLTVSGGTSAYTYNWDSGASTSEDRTGLSNGTYNVVVTDVNGCTANTSVTIVRPDLLSGSATATDVSCNGGVTGAVNLTPAGGNGGYSYLWSNAATTEDLSNVAAGSYSVTITDSKGCTAAASATVAAKISISGTITDVKCFGGSTGAVDISVTGGLAPYTYAWTGPSSYSASTQDISGRITGSYAVTVTDAHSCSETLSFTIGTSSALNISVNAVDRNCLAPNGYASAVVSGGAAPYTYSWSPGGLTTGNIYGLAAGTYTVTVIDANGCTGSASGTVNLSAATVSIDAFSPATSSRCQAAGNATYTTTATNSFGITYSLDPTSLAAGNTISAATGEVNYVANWNGTTTITATASGCPSSVTTTHVVTVIPASVGGTATATASSLCTGSSTTISLTGYNGTIQWQQSANGSSGWANVTGGSGATTDNYTTPVLTSTTYYRAVATNGSCTSSNSSTATVTVAPVSVGGSASGDQTICSGTTPTDLTLSGKTGIVLKWQKSADDLFTTPEDILESNTTLAGSAIGTLTATTYFRAVVQSGVCSEAYSSYATVTVDASVGGTAASDQTICSGGSPANITLSGNTGTIQWQVSSNNSSFSDIVGATASPLISAQMGTLTATRYYRAVVTNGTCTADNSSTATVTVAAQPVGPTLLAKTPNQAIFCVSAGVSATFTVGSGGSGCSDDYTVTIDGGSPVAYTPGSTVGAAATTSIEIKGRRANCTGGTGCTGTSYVTLASWVKDNVNPTITCPLDITQDVDPGFCTALVTLPAPSAMADNCGGTPTLTWSGNSGVTVTDATHATVAVGTSTITYRATDAAGNYSECSFDVTVVDNINPTITCPAPATVSGFGGIPAKLNAGNFGAGAADNCGISTINAVDTYSNVCTPGTDLTITRTYTVTDSHGNTATCDQTITVQDVSIEINSVSLTACSGKSVTFTSSVNGFSVTNYQWETSTNGGATWSTLSNGVGVSGATSASLVISSPVVGHKYRLKVSTGTANQECYSNVLTLVADTSIPQFPVTASKYSGGIVMCAQTAAVAIPDLISITDAVDNCTDLADLRTTYSITLPNTTVVTGTDANISVLNSYAFPIGTSEVTMDIVDQSGYRSGSITFQVKVGTVFTLSDITTDLPLGTNGTGNKPYQGSSHTYTVDTGVAEAGYTYTWTVADKDNIVLAPNSANTYTINTTNPAAVVITWGASIPLAGNDYKVRVRKRNNATTCYIDKELGVTVLENQFNAKVENYGDQCQHGESGTMIASWTITKTGGANNWRFDYEIWKDGFLVASSSHVNATGNTGTVEYSVTNQAGVNKTYLFKIFSVFDEFDTPETNTDDNEDSVTLYGVPNTSVITIH